MKKRALLFSLAVLFLSIAPAAFAMWDDEYQCPHRRVQVAASTAIGFDGSCWYCILTVHVWCMRCGETLDYRQERYEWCDSVAS